VKILAIIQARLGSTRLPGKVMEKIGHLTVLEHCYKRVLVGGLPCVIACPDKDADRLEHKLKLPIFGWAGDENDVAGRYRACVERYQPKYVVRITADCPFVPPEHIEAVANLAVALDGYVTNVHPRTWPDGTDVQAFPATLLRSAQGEHVLDYAIQPEAALTCPTNLGAKRWTIDTAEDLAWAQAVAAKIDTNDVKATGVWRLLHSLREHGLDRVA